MIIFMRNQKPAWNLWTLFSPKNVNKILPKTGKVFYASEVGIIPKPNLRLAQKKKVRKIEPGAWILLVIPVSAMALGTWQIKRKIWKEELNKKLQERATLEPVDYPKNLEEIKDMEYVPVRVKGKFDHSKEIYIGPRPLIQVTNYTYDSSLLSTSKAGFVIVTPFTLSDRNLTILVNRGWVPAAQKSPSTREQGQVTDEVELIGLIRLSEAREPLGMKNFPEKGIWTYRDLNKMAEVTGAAPYMIDLVKSSNVPGGPIGGQTILKRENQHLIYTLTWYTLGLTTGYMWYAKYIKRSI